MQRFILFRVGQAIIAVLLVSIIVFMLSNITGDATSVMLPMGEAMPEDIQALKAVSYTHLTLPTIRLV